MKKLVSLIGAAFGLGVLGLILGGMPGVMCLVTAAMIGYFLPTVMGSHKRNALAIFVLNFTLGWTLVGWVVALVWAMSYEAPLRPEYSAE